MKLASLLLATGAALPAACLIGGTVVDADTGKPLPRTRVFASPSGQFGAPAILRVTDAQGVFCFEQLAPNIYHIVAERTRYMVSVYGARPGSDEGVLFHVKQNELPPLKIRLLPGAAIGGTVLDSDGEPLRDVNVQLSRKVWEKVWTSDAVKDANSDEHGAFRFSMLAPGTYYLSVAPTQHEFAETFYAGSFSFAHATPIPLKAGDEINLALAANRPASRHLSGSLSPEMRPVRQGAILELSIEGSMRGGVWVFIGGDGTFSADALAPAEYRFSINNADFGANGSVDLTGGDVTGFVIERHPTVDLQVTARIEGRTGPAHVPLAAIGRESGDGPHAKPDEAGAYHFRQLPAGIYRFEPQDQGPGPRLYAKRVLIDGRPQPDAWLDLTKSAPAGVELLLGSNPAALGGHLEAREGGTHALAVTVVAVDETRSGVELTYRTTVADDNGEFALGDLAPGKWRVFAIESFDEGPWGNPELAQALREKSVAVELQEGRESSLKLPEISLEEWEAALRKVGM